MQQGNEKQASEVSFEEFAPATYAEWRDAAVEALKGADFDKTLFTKLVDGITLNPIYNAEDVKTAIDEPGQFPYRRGTRPLGYRSKPWDIAQGIQACSPEGFNKKALEELSKGGTAVNITLNCKKGVKLSNLADWNTALKGIDLAATPVYVSLGSCGLATLSMLAEAARNNGYGSKTLKGGVLFDPLGKLVMKGSICGGMGFCGAKKQMASMMKWALANTTDDFATIGVSGLPYHNAGASAFDEVAAMIATAVTYLRAMEAAGFSVDQVAPRIRFTVGVGSNLFLEIAKIRALRMLWAQIVVACGGSEESAKIKLHAATSSWTISKVDPWVNMLRGTAQAFSAVIGGVDSLDVTPFDAGVRRPDEFARRIARNVQLILQGECNLDKVVDPAGGSYYIETLTDEVARESWKRFQKIESEGGMVSALKTGSVQKDINATAAKRFEFADQRRQTYVGVNRYVNLEEKPLETGACPAKGADAGAPKCCHADAAEVALQGDSVEDVTAVLGSATTCGIQKALAGIYACPVGITVEPLPVRHATERFERLLDKAVAYQAKTGSRPKVFLATMGPLRQYKARADFSQDFLRAGGFDTMYPAGFKTVQEAADAAVKSGLGACVICSTDDTYGDIVPEFCAAVKAAKPDMTIMLAGYPKEQVPAFEAAGVDMFIHVRANCHDVLDTLQNKLGI